MRSWGFRTTAAATTGPNSEPRPTSSTPATSLAPACQACFSKRCVQRSLFSRRIFSAEGEIPCSFPVLPGFIPGFMSVLEVSTHFVNLATEISPVERCFGA